MTTHTVEFRYETGFPRSLFRNARLRGSWDGDGRYCPVWTDRPMREVVGADGCPSFVATVSLDLADAGREFRWGVVLDGPQGANLWGIPTEVRDVSSAERYRTFRLAPAGAPQVERYALTYLRRLGANKRHAGQGGPARLWFGVWAPNAQRVDVVFGTPSAGYIDDAGRGIDPRRPAVPLVRSAEGIWEGGPAGDFADFRGVPYMFRIVNAQGRTVFRTDVFSRSQIGAGDVDPAADPSWPGTAATLDGSVSCSVVIDPDVVRRSFASAPGGGIPRDLVPAEEFWATEHTLEAPVPTRVEDLVIYELHVGSLGFGKATPGDLGDAVAFLDHLVDLGVNAVELMPLAEFPGSSRYWGYGDTHHLCVESTAGGRDKYRHFVRECHRRGIAVIQDVVYNHYNPRAERAQWQYDSTDPEQNIYYWYEGRPSDHRRSDGTAFPDGGYVDAGWSTGWAPRYWEEVVRQQFISSAAFLVEEMHVDGLRVDLTDAMHRDNRLHADGRELGHVNVFGQKLLREWSRTLRLLRPSVMLFAEDHSGWEGVTRPPAQGGLGFDARWQLAFYHHLVGDSDMAGDHRARLLKRAGTGGDEPLGMDRFSGALYDSRHGQVVFHESHDECGNAKGTERTLVTAVNGAPLVDATRLAAEARARVCAGLSILSAGTPMFFMGEESGAQKKVTYTNAASSREDILGDRQNGGKALFRFYQELIGLRRRLRSVRTHDIDILHQSTTSRVVAFKRWCDGEEVIVVASLNNAPFDRGYVIQKDLAAIPGGGWKEIFNSDAAIYGGRNVGNGGAVLHASGGRLDVKVPANGFVVLVRQ